jgi:kynureninase
MLPAETVRHQQEVVLNQWGTSLIRSWNDHGWIEAPQRIGARIARLIGAKPHEVIVTDSVTVNLFKLITAAARLSPERPVLLSEAGNFHTDLHVASGAVEAVPNMRLEVVARRLIEETVGPETNLLLLTHVHYKSAARYDMAAVTAHAKAAGARTIWDLSHSAGAVPLHLNRDGAELAVGCGYKYLNGGPGAPAFLYVAEHLQEELSPMLRGWMGHAAPFDFTDHYVPAPGIARFLAGTPPMLSMAALECGIRSFDGVDMDALWEKSVALFDLFARLVEERCSGHSLECITAPEARASRQPHLLPAPARFRALPGADRRRRDRRLPRARRGPLRHHTALSAIRGRLGGRRPSRFHPRGRSWREPRFALRGKVT